MEVGQHILCRDMKDMFEYREALKKVGIITRPVSRDKKKYLLITEIKEMKSE